jgi:3-oxoacid CoA-transferase subunit B
MPFDRDAIAERAAREVAPGSIVNLGIGLPTLVAGYLPADAGVWLHTENGLLGMGPYPYEGEEHAQIINAGKETVTVVPGGSCFDSAASFGMIRGGHVDLTILGAMQVSQRGDLANWSVPGGKTMGIGGAMDLAAGARRILVLTTHVTKSGEPKLVSECSYPLTAKAVVSRIITDLAVLDVAGDGFCLVELAPDVTLDTLRARTGAPVLLTPLRA